MRDFLSPARAQFQYATRRAGLASRRGIPVFYNTCFMEEMQHTDRPVLRFFYNFRAYLRSSLPMALRGRGSVLNSTAVIRWYSGRIRFNPVIKARTSACFS